jgi:hypothetical protein
LTERRIRHILGPTSCSRSQLFTIVHTRMVIEATLVKNVRRRSLN